MRVAKCEIPILQNSLYSKSETSHVAELQLILFYNILPPKKGMK